MLASGAAVAGTWQPVATAAPGSVAVMLLLSDGTVAVHCGDGISTSWFRLTPNQLGSYANGTWTTLAPMHYSRLYFSSEILQDGRLFVAGGEYGTGGTHGEIYDPLTNSWTVTPNPGVDFYDSMSEMLPDGRVLIAPVGASRTTIIYDPVANSWTAGPEAAVDQDEATWLKLPDNSILTTDAPAMPPGTSTATERYIPSQNAWVADATMQFPLWNSEYEIGPAFLLPDGRGFLIGGGGYTAYYTPSGNASPGSFTQGAFIPEGLVVNDGCGCMLVTGNILMDASPNTKANAPTTFFEFDYTNDTFTIVDGPTGIPDNVSSYETDMLVLPDGTVLYSNFSSQLYIYTPSGTPLAAGAPTISSITPNGDGSFQIAGTLLNGISQGAVYGDDNQMFTNYPIVQLDDGSGDIYYARTYGWSSTGVATGSQVLTANFTLPAGIPNGTYALTVSANGISSAPTSFNVMPIVVSLPSRAGVGSAPLMGTVTLPTAATSDLTVNLASSNASATPSASVIVASGQKSANFTLTVVGDAILSSEQAVAVSASAAGYQAGQTVIVITNASVPLLVVAPTTTLSVSGLSSGPFSPASTAYTLTNPGPAAVAWACTSTDPKLIAISPSSGILGAGKSAMATVSFRSGVNVGPVGTYTPNITFTNRTNGRGDTEIPVAISVTGSLPAGSFNGLVTPPTGVTPTQGQAGLIRWTTTASGQFTGTLQLGGYTYALTGAVDSTGLVHFGRSGATPVTLLRGKLPSLELSLQLTLGGEIDQITGTVTEGGSPFAQIEAERAVYTSLKNPVPPLENPPTGLVGAYTAIFSFKAAPNNTLPATAYPQADGYGLLTVGSSGMVHIAGTLADGTAISYSNALTPAATWPVYVSLQSGNGSIGGVATFADNPGVSDLAGLGLYWFKPASATAKRYPGGWTGGIQTDLLGSKFVLPAKGSGQSLFPGLGPASTMGNATAALTVDGVTDSESVDISASNVVTVLPPNPAKLGLSLSTSGLFSGSFTSAGKLVPLHGVVFQKQGQGFGFFLGADATGSVTLAP